MTLTVVHALGIRLIILTGLPVYLGQERDFFHPITSQGLACRNP